MIYVKLFIKKLSLLAFLSFVLFYTSNAQFNGTFTDNRDGYNYNAIKAGEQEWLGINLFAKKFLDGTSIKQAKTREEWQELSYNKEPAWCFYNFNEENYYQGLYYNDWAVRSPRGLAPKGWKIPSTEDWDRLIDYFLLADTNYMYSGINLLKGGYCDEGGDFYRLDQEGCFWTSSVHNGFLKKARFFTGNTIKESIINSKYGLTVRCIKKNKTDSDFDSQVSSKMCSDSFKEISPSNISGTARKYQGENGKYYYQVKLYVSPSVETKNYTTRIDVFRLRSYKDPKFEGVTGLGTIGGQERINKGSFKLNANSGIITIDGCLETDIYQVEGIYSCETGRFKGPSATIYFRNLKIIK